MKFWNRECLQRGQLKNLIDEARSGGVCKNAAAFIRDLDEEFDDNKKSDKKADWKADLTAMKKKVLSWF